MDLKEIQELIKFVSKIGVSEVELEREGFKIVIKTDTKQDRVTEYVQMPQQMMHAPAPVAMPAAPVAATPVATDESSKYITINSPMIGTFYRTPGPDKDAFVQVGDDVNQGDTVCIIEAMKLFNEIESEIKGKIVKVLVESSSPVEYNQPLFLVDPS